MQFTNLVQHLQKLYGDYGHRLFAITETDDAWDVFGRIEGNVPTEWGQVGWYY
jgi:hypothetical protein